MLIEIIKNKHSGQYHFALCDKKGVRYATSMAYKTKPEAVDKAFEVKEQAASSEVWDLNSEVINRISR